jgi:hypothetical protein
LVPRALAVTDQNDFLHGGSPETIARYRTLFSDHHQRVRSRVHE